MMAMIYISIFIVLNIFVLNDIHDETIVINMSECHVDITCCNV